MEEFTSVKSIQTRIGPRVLAYPHVTARGAQHDPQGT